MHSQSWKRNGLPNLPVTLPIVKPEPANKQEPAIKQETINRTSPRLANKNPLLPAPQMAAKFVPIDMHPNVLADTCKTLYNETTITNQEMLTQLLISHAAVFSALKLIDKNGEGIDTIVKDFSTDITFLHNIACEYSTSFIGFGLMTGARPKNQNLSEMKCGRCALTLGDWTGKHKDGSACTATGCALCTSLGIGKGRSSDDDSDTHDMKKCPFYKTNLPLFYEYVKRRLDFKGRHLKTQPVRVAGAQRDQFMNSLHDDSDE